MRLEDMERVGPAAREGRTEVGRVRHHTSGCKWTLLSGWSGEECVRP